MRQSVLAGTFVTVQIEQDRKARRILVPDAILEACGWKGKAVGDLVGEVRAKGHLRLHRKAAISQQLEIIRAGLEEKTAEDQTAIEELAAFHSRYIEISYYEAARRVRLSKEALVILADDNEEQLRRCYVQAVKPALDLLSLPAYFERLGNAGSSMTTISNNDNAN